MAPPHGKITFLQSGTRRKTDKKQFQSMLDESKKLSTNIPIMRAHFPDECRLIKEWHTNKSLVFFDFNETGNNEHSIL